MISFDTNNGNVITIHQDGHDKPLEVFSSVIGTYYIEPGDVVMLLNYYRNCKDGTEQSDYIARDSKKEM